MNPRPRPAATVDQPPVQPESPAPTTEGASTMAATVTPISPAASESTTTDKRAAAIERRKAEAAALREKLAAMTPEQQSAYKAQLKAERQKFYAEQEANRKIPVARRWLLGIADALAQVSSAAAEGKTVTFKDEVLKPDVALARMSTAIRAQATTSGKKATTVKSTDKVWVVVRTGPDGSRLAYEKTFNGNKAEQNAQADANRKAEFLQKASIDGYSFTPMKLADVQSSGIAFAEKVAA